MTSMDHQDEDVICEDDEPQESLPDWAPAFRIVCRYLDQQGHLEELDEMAGLERRADSYRLIDVVMSLVAYMCANIQEGGLREFWYTVREDQEKLAAWYGRRELPSSSSVSRFLQEVSPELVREFSQWALGEATDVGAMANRAEAMWRDTWGEGWHVVDWDPNGRFLRQRTLVDSEDHPEQTRRGPKHGAAGHVGRERGELKFVRGLMVHSGTSQWLGAYRQEGNGTLMDDIEVADQARRTLDQQLDSEFPPIMRIDGEGGEVCVINGLEEAGWCPLVRLKQYHLLDRKDVWESIQKQTPELAEGTGSGPVREVFEIGEVPLTSNRDTDELQRWDEPIEIRLIVSRYPKTDADEGPGKLIDGMRYELFGTYLPRRRWPAEAVVDLYFGRATIENYFAGADREIDLEKMFSEQNPAGQQLATTVGLWAWNLMVELGDRLVDRESCPEPARRGPTASEAESRRAARQTGAHRRQGQKGGDERSEPVDTQSTEAELSESTLQRLNTMGMTYRPESGVLECAAGHHLAPIKSGARDENSVRFRIIGRPCRGCLHRNQCSDSTNPDFRKEVSILGKEVPGAVTIRDEECRVPVGVRQPTDCRAGPLRIQRPGLMAAKRRRTFRRAARRARIRVNLTGVQRSHLAHCAREHSRYQRTRQRLPRRMRRRYRRLPADASVTCEWVRGTELAQIVA